MKSLIRLLRYIKPYTAAAVAAPLLMALEVTMDLAQPQFVRRIIDTGIILQTGITMLIFAFVGMIGGVGCTIFASHASQKMGADVILVVNDGRIVERGTHDGLLDVQGFYANLYRSQFRGLDPVRG